MSYLSHREVLLDNVVRKYLGASIIADLRAAPESRRRGMLTEWFPASLNLVKSVFCEEMNQWKGTT